MNRSLIQAGRWRDGGSCSCFERSRSGAGGQQVFPRHFGAWVNCHIQCFGRAQTNKLRNTHDTSLEPVMIYLLLASSTETLISSETHRTWNKHTAPLAKQDLVELCHHRVVNRLQKYRLFVLKRAILLQTGLQSSHNSVYQQENVLVWNSTEGRICFTSIWVRVHRKHFERAVPLKTLLPVNFKESQSDFLNIAAIW